MKRFIASFLALAIFTTTSAHALPLDAGNSSIITPDTNVLAFDLPRDATHPGATLIIHEVQPSDEADVGKQVASHDGVILAGSTLDPALPQVRQENASIVYAGNAAEANADIQIHALNDLTHAHNKRKELHNALLIALVPATGYGVYFFYMTHSYVRSAGGMALAYVLASLITVYTDKWLGASRLTGDKANDLYVGMASRLGKTVSAKAQTRIQRFGQTSAAFGLNVVSGLSTLFFSNQLHKPGDAAVALLFALFSSHEVIDYIFENEITNHQVVKKAMNWRLVICAMIELTATSNLVPGFDIFAGTFVSGAILAYVFSEERTAGVRTFRNFVSKNYSRGIAATAKVKEISLSRVRSVIGKLKSRANKPCETALTLGRLHDLDEAS